MQNFQDTFETHKRSFISAFSICMTVPLSRIHICVFFYIRACVEPNVHPHPFLFIFSVFASSSPSQNKKDSCKKMMLIDRHHFENKDFISWSCFYLEPQLHVSPYIQKYANVSKTLRKTQFVRRHLWKTWGKALCRKLRKCECGLKNTEKWTEEQNTEKWTEEQKINIFEFELNS